MHSKICVFTSAHSANDVRIYKKQISCLLNEGYEIFYYTNKDKEENAVNPKLTIFYYKSYNEDQRIRRFFRSLFLIFKLTKKCQIYHFHDPDLLLTGLLLKMLGKRVVYDVHENYRDSILDKEYLPKFFRRIISNLVSFLETSLSYFFNLIICATPNIEERFKRANVNKTIVINNFPFKYEFSRPEVSLNKKKDLIIYAGAITQKRGITQLINSLCLINEKRTCNLRLAGEIYPKSYEKFLYSLDGWKYVEYLGILPRMNLAKELNMAKAGIVLFLPERNHINSQPNKFFEYMSAGIPVISSHFPLWVDIIRKNNCGICVNPKNLQEIADAILQILSDDVMREQMGENGKKAVTEKYNWENEQKKLISAYNFLRNQ